jgi:hypothetical protein
VATLVARNINDLAKSAFGDSLESGRIFGVGAFHRNLASVAINMFSRSIYFINKFYKCCTFSAICKDNDALSRITAVQRKRVHSRQLDCRVALCRLLCIC